MDRGGTKNKNNEDKKIKFYKLIIRKCRCISHVLVVGKLK